MNVSPSLFPTPGVNIMTATTTKNANKNSTKAEYFNINIKGLDCLRNIRRIETLTGGYKSVVINSLSGTTDSHTYVRFDATVAGKETTDLINRGQKAADEDQKVLLGFNLSNLT